MFPQPVTSPSADGPDEGLLPRIVGEVAAAADARTLHALEPAQRVFRVDPGRVRRHVEVQRYIVSGTPFARAEAGVAPQPLSFVACVNDEDPVNANLLRSPCLDPGTPHRAHSLRGQSSAAAGFGEGLGA